MWNLHLAVLFSAAQLISCGYVNQGALVSKNYLVDHLPTWSPTWYVSFQVQPIHKSAHWTNVVRFTAGTQNYKRLGDRVPAVFFVPHTTKLHICTSLNNHINYCYNSHPLPLHQWATVEISQVQWGAKYFYIIRINGQTVRKVENAGARYYMGVNVFRGDNFYAPAPARIRQLTYRNLPSVFKLVKNTIIKAFRAYFTEYEVSFDIKPFGKVHSWASILHVTEWDDISAYGNRIPAVFFHPNTNKLHICSAINGNKNYCWNDKTDLPTNKFSHVIIKQKLVGHQYVYAIYLNGKQVFHIVNTRPITLYRAKVYLSNPWYSAAQAFVKRVRVTTTSGGGFKLLKNKLINIIPRIQPQWYLSFDIKPENKAIYGWGSIIHLTTSGNYGRVGYRIPGIWFNPNSRRLHICYAINHYHNRCVNSHQLPAHHWSSIQVLQVFDQHLKKYKFVVLVNNHVKASIINLRPQSFQNVKMYVADPWHHAALAQVRRIVFRNTHQAVSHK